MEPLYKSVNGERVLMTEEEASRIKTEWAYNDNISWEVNRLAEYPPIVDLADAIYWSSRGDNSKMEMYLSAVEAVKLKYPKPDTK
jgi:hypothetical protein